MNRNLLKMQRTSHRTIQFQRLLNQTIRSLQNPKNPKQKRRKRYNTGSLLKKSKTLISLPAGSLSAHRIRQYSGKKTWSFPIMGICICCPFQMRQELWRPTVITPGKWILWTQTLNSQLPQNRMPVTTEAGWSRTMPFPN